MSSTKPVGRALLFEHLPDIKFRQCVQGVLFVVFSNGEAFFYPLDQTKNSGTGHRVQLTKESGGSKKKNAAINLGNFILLTNNEKIVHKEKLDHFNLITTGTSKESECNIINILMLNRVLLITNLTDFIKNTKQEEFLCLCDC